MKKSLIISYIKNITKEDILKFSIKQNIILNKKDLDIIYTSIKNDYEVILSNDFYDYLKKKKQYLQEQTYNKILELSNKYKDFIN